MDWTQVLTVFAIVATNLTTVIILFCHSDKKTEEHRIESARIIDSIRTEVRDFNNAIREDMKDFHGRLCAIEERNKK